METIEATRVQSEGGTLSRLVALRDKSWLVLRGDRSGAPRLRMDRVLRTFVARELEDEERETLRRAHALHRVERAERLAAQLEQGGEAVGELCADLPDLHAAIAWALERDDADRALLAARGLGALCALLRATGPLDAIIALLDAHLPQLVRSLPAGWIATLLSARCEARRRSGQWSASAEDGAAAYDHALESGEPEVVASAALQLGFSLARCGEVERSRALFDEALGAFEARGNDLGLGLAFCGLALLSRQAGAHEDAIAHLESSIHALRRGGALRSSALMLNNLGTLHMNLGAWAPARCCFEDASEHEAAIGDRVSAAMTLGNQGVLAFVCGREEQAVATMERAIVAATEAGAGQALRNATGYLGMVRLSRGEFEVARGLLDRALRENRTGARPACVWVFESALETLERRRLARRPPCVTSDRGECTRRAVDPRAARGAVGVGGARDGGARDARGRCALIVIASARSTACAG